MSSQFKHFLITRFNLAFEVWSQDKNHNLVRTDDWLQKKNPTIRRILPS